MISLKALFTAPGSVPLSHSAARAVAVLEALAIAIAALATLVLIGKLLMRSAMGYDFTDEGFYLNWISHPSDYPIPLAQFGYIYHPIYELAGRSVSTLRQANILTCYVLALAACVSMVRRHVRDGGEQFSLSLGVIGVLIVTASASLLPLVFASSLWLPTPSYNSLTFQSLLLASIGFCLAEPSATRMSVAGWIIVGVAGFLSFMGKPPSALVLGIVILVALLVSGKLSSQLLGISVATSSLLLVGYAWLVDGSILQFAADLQRAVDAASILESSHEVGKLLRFDKIKLDPDEIRLLIGSTLLITLLGLATFSSRPAIKIAGMLGKLALACVAVALTSELLVVEFQNRMFEGIQLLAVFLAAAICFIMNSIFGHEPRLSRQSLGSVLFFAFLPFAYAVGTGNNYWRVGSSAAFFLTLSSFTLVADRLGQASWRRLSPLAISSLVMTIIIVEHGMAHPYRDPNPLSASTIPVRIGGNTDMLFLNSNFAGYLGALRDLSHKAGFRARTPLIDLTGHYPGSLYALAAKPLGAAWLIGGYSGSDRLAATYLDSVPCKQLVSAWVLIEPDGPLRLSRNLLERYGIDLERDFDVAATLAAPIAQFPISYKQQLLKPRRPMQDATSSCEIARNAVN